MVDLDDLLSRVLSNDPEELGRRPYGVPKRAAAPAVGTQRKTVEVTESRVELRADDGLHEALQV